MTKLERWEAGGAPHLVILLLGHQGVVLDELVGPRGVRLRQLLQISMGMAVGSREHVSADVREEMRDGGMAAGEKWVRTKMVVSAKMGGNHLGATSRCKNSLKKKFGGLPKHEHLECTRVTRN